MKVKIMNNKAEWMKIIAVGLIMLMIPVLSGCSNENQQLEGPEQVDLTAETSRQIEAFGKVTAPEAVSLSLKIPARIKKILVQEGQEVSAGQVLMELDFSDHRQRTSEIEGEMAVIRAEMEASSRSLSQETIRLNQDLEYEETRLEQALKEKERHQTLHRAGAIPMETLEEVEKRVEEQQKQVQDLVTAMKLKEDAYQLNVYRERIRELEARKQRLLNQMDMSDLNNNELINSFEKAVVTDISKTAGDGIEAGERIGKLLRLDHLEVEADVLEEFIRDVHIGTTVTFIPVADRSRTYHGRVTFIAGTATLRNSETVVPIRVSIDDADEFLKPEFNMDLYIDVST